MYSKTFAISLLNYFSAEKIEHIIEMIDRQDADIFILDNGSGEKEYAELKTFAVDKTHVFLHQNPVNRGFTGGHNDNLAYIKKQGSYQYLLLLNPDVTIPANFLQQFSDGIQQAKNVDPQAAVFGPAVHTSLGPKNIVQYGGCTSLRFAQGYPNTSPTHDYQFISGCCLVIDRNLVPTPLFDEQFFLYYDEVDLCFRMQRAGYTMQHIDSCFIEHHQNYLYQISPHFLYSRHRSRLLFAKKRAHRYQRPTICLRTIVLFFYFSIYTRGKGLLPTTLGIWHGISNHRTARYF